jgi:site-specific DNA-methyltransferase (adenine-specific)
MIFFEYKYEVKTMSRVLGKSSNWGSRSGKKATQKKEINELFQAGLSDKLLEKIASNPELISQLATEILLHRNEIKISKQELNLAHTTQYGNLYHGDCIQLLQNIEDNSFDCIFADPPFNLNKDYHPGVSDLIPDHEYLEWTRVWLDLCIDKLKEGGAFYIFNIPKWNIEIAKYVSERLTFKNWIAIDLTLSMPIPNKLYPSHYSLLYFIKGDRAKTFNPPRVPIETCVKCGFEQKDYGGYKMKMNPLGINLRDIWTDIPPVRHSKYKTRDANELSVKLLDRVLDISTEENDLVFDPFGGSGTSYVVAELKKRQWLGVELGSCDSIINRLNDLDSEQEKLDKYRKNINLLFTDESLIRRKKFGLPLDNYNILQEQIDRIFNSKH